MNHPSASVNAFVPGPGRDDGSLPSVEPPRDDAELRPPFAGRSAVAGAPPHALARLVVPRRGQHGPKLRRPVPHAGRMHAGPVAGDGEAGLRWDRRHATRRRALHGWQLARNGRGRRAAASGSEQRGRDRRAEGQPDHQRSSCRTLGLPQPWRPPCSLVPRSRPCRLPACSGRSRGSVAGCPWRRTAIAIECEHGRLADGRKKRPMLEVPMSSAMIDGTITVDQIARQVRPLRRVSACWKACGRTRCSRTARLPAVSDVRRRPTRPRRHCRAGVRVKSVYVFGAATSCAWPRGAPDLLGRSLRSSSAASHRPIERAAVRTPCEPRRPRWRPEYLRFVLEQNGWNQTRTARRLDMPLRTLVHRMKVLGVRGPDPAQ